MRVLYQCVPEVQLHCRDDTVVKQECSMNTDIILDIGMNIIIFIVSIIMFIFIFMYNIFIYLIYLYLIFVLI